MKLKFILLFSILFSWSLNAQVTEAEEDLKDKTADSTDGWNLGGVISVNLTQTSLTNWAAGGQNSISVAGLISTYAKLKKGKATWDNSLDIGYGVLRQGNYPVWMKTDDKLDLFSKYGRLAAKNLYYAALLNFRTQMAPGYNYPNDSVRISNFMAPGYLIGAIGMDYKPNKYLSLFVSPLTSKNTFVNDATLANAGAFGVRAAELDTAGNVITPGEKFRTEMGGYLRFIFQKDDFEAKFLKNVSLMTKLDLFSNYLDRPENIDVNWETLITLKVNEILSVSISTQLIYDNDIKIQVDKNNDGIIDTVGPRVQFKEILGVGIAYKFSK